MKPHTLLIGVILVIFMAGTKAQIPKRLQIPGALPVGAGERPLPLRRLVQQPVNAPPRDHRNQQYKLRRPVPNALPPPLPAVRPVIEEQDDGPISSINLNEEVARLSQIPIASSTPRQQFIDDDDDDDEPAPRPYAPPVQFRPERPAIQVAQPVRAPPQSVRQQSAPVRAVPVRQAARPAPRPQAQYIDDEPGTRRERTKRPPVQILRKYREDNPDGSITWGFENDDGTFKEETIGIDCITRGNYGYIDPDGNRREYTYETGLKCDQQEPELPEETYIQPAPGKQFKRPPPPQGGRLA